MKTLLVAILLASVCFLCGCGGGGGGGYLSQTAGIAVTNLDSDIIGTIALASAIKNTTPFGVRRAYERKGNDDCNNILVSGRNLKIDQESFQISGNGQVDISWYFNRPELINEVKIDISGSGNSSMELKYVGETEDKVLKTYKITGELSSEKPKRISAKDVTKGIWKVVLSIKGDNINVSISKNSEDIVVDSIGVDLRNFKEIFKNESFLKNTEGLKESNRFSVANSINLTLQRFACEPTQGNIDTILSPILNTRTKYENYPILNRNTQCVVILKGTAMYNLDFQEYCKNLGIEERKIQVIDSQQETDAGKKFLEAITKSKGNTAVLISTHGNKNFIEVKRPASQTESSYVFSQDIARALQDRENLGEYGDISFCVDSCYSADFVEDVLNRLNYYKQNGELKTKKIFVARANRNQISWDWMGALSFFPKKEELKDTTSLTVGDMMGQEEQDFYPNDFAFFAPTENTEKFNELKKFSVYQGKGLTKDIPIIDLNKVLRPVITRH